MIFVGLGSNVGDRLGYLLGAVRELHASARIEVIRTSSVYETDPVGPSQPDFLNAVVEISTTLEPRELLRRFQGIEARLGRVQRERWGPREIDIDLLVYDDHRIETDDLRVPHPGLVQRAFVLVPLAELAPDAEVAGAGSVRELLQRVGSAGVRRFDGTLA